MGQATAPEGEREIEEIGKRLKETLSGLKRAGHEIKLNLTICPDEDCKAKKTADRLKFQLLRPPPRTPWTPYAQNWKGNRSSTKGAPPPTAGQTSRRTHARCAHSAPPLQAAARSASARTRVADYRSTRPKIERKLGHLMRRRHGGRRVRVRGTTRVDADFRLLAAALHYAVHLLTRPKPDTNYGLPRPTPWLTAAG